MNSAKISVRLLPWILITILAAPLWTAPAAQAQTRSETGRHKPPPPPEDEAQAKTVAPHERMTKPWYAGVIGGVLGGSDMFRVEVVSGLPVPWEPGFTSKRFTVSLDRNFEMGFFVGRDLNRVWSIRGDVGYSRMDAVAEALVGQTGAVFLFDRMDVLNLGLGVEARLTKAPSYPYFQAAILYSHLDAASDAELTQGNLGGRIGLGYLQTFEKFWGLRFEVRLSRTGFSVGDYVPQAELPAQPTIDYQTEDHLTYFEFLIGLQVSL